MHRANRAHRHHVARTQWQWPALCPPLSCWALHSESCGALLHQGRFNQYDARRCLTGSSKWQPQYAVWPARCVHHAKQKPCTRCTVQNTQPLRVFHSVCRCRSFHNQITVKRIACNQQSNSVKRIACNQQSGHKRLAPFADKAPEILTYRMATRHLGCLILVYIDPEILLLNKLQCSRGV